MKTSYLNSLNRRPTAGRLQAQVDAFNARVAVGDTVLLKCDGVDTLTEHTTRSAAEILSGHSAVIWLNGISGSYCLSHVAPLPGPGVHSFDSTEAAYQAVSRRKVCIGDVLLIPSECVVGVACSIPFAVTPAHGYLAPWPKGDHDLQWEFLIPIAKARTVAETMLDSAVHAESAIHG